MVLEIKSTFPILLKLRRLKAASISKRDSNIDKCCILRPKGAVFCNFFFLSKELKKI